MSKKKKSFLEYINQSACIEIEGLEDYFFFLFFWWACFTKKSGNIRGPSVSISISISHEVTDLVLFFLFVNLQVSVCFYFIWLFFQYFCYFLIFNKKDGAMYLSFLLMTAKNHFTNRVTFCFYCFSSRTARHELKWESDRGAPVRTVASLGNTAGFTLQCPIYFSSSSSATVKKIK